jgi:hypothetical protein
MHFLVFSSFGGAYQNQTTTTDMGGAFRGASKSLSALVDFSVVLLDNRGGESAYRTLFVHNSFPDRL